MLFSVNVMMLAAESGKQNLGQWSSYTDNVGDDLNRSCVILMLYCNHDRQR